MLVVMNADASAEQIQNVVRFLQGIGYEAEPLPGHSRTAIGVRGNVHYVPNNEVLRLPGVRELIRVTKPYKLVSKEFHPLETLVQVGEVVFGGPEPVLIAGPCSVESEAQVFATAHKVKALGAGILRGGLFKPRTSPYSFQGVGYQGLPWLQAARAATGLPICVELMSINDLDLFAAEVDLIQVGARNMQNFDLLKHLAKLDKPVLLKRGASATVEEFLLAAEYLLEGGNPNVILCERGIRTFETSTRNQLDVNSIALIRQLSHLPIIADPSHAAGRFDLVPPLAKAALAAGAQGLILETHPKPHLAKSDAEQQLDFAQLEALVTSLRPLIAALALEAIPA